MCEGMVNAKKQGEYYAPIMDIGMIKSNCGQLSLLQLNKYSYEEILLDK